MAFLRNSVAEALDISISDYTLDAGYCSMPLIAAFCPEWEDDDGGDDTETCGKTRKNAVRPVARALRLRGVLQ